MKMRDLEVLMQPMIPYIKVSNNFYLIGTDLKKLEIKSQSVMVRVGGGF